MQVIFPWYPKELSPNARAHWTLKAKKNKEYKGVCYYRTKEAISKSKASNYDHLKEFHLTFYKPNRRAMDADNMLASIKSGLDGMCQALRIDDQLFKKIVIEIEDDIGGYIKVEVR